MGKSLDQLLGGTAIAPYGLKDHQHPQAEYFAAKKITHEKFEKFGEKERIIMKRDMKEKVQLYFSAFELLLKDSDCLTANVDQAGKIAQYAVIAALLDSGEGIKYLEIALEKVGKILEYYFSKSPRSRNKLSRALMTYMQPFGFHTGGPYGDPYGESPQNRKSVTVDGYDLNIVDSAFPEMNYDRVVLAGEVSTKTFKQLIRSGIIFKDGISTVHGEFTHAFQWCIVGEALQQGFDFTNFTVERQGTKTSIGVPSLNKGNVCETYRKLIDYEFRNSGKLTEQFFLTGEVAGAKEGGRQKKFLLWDLIVDSFISRVDKDPPGHLLFNVFTTGCRAPAFISTHIQTSYGILSDYYKGRYSAAKRIAILPNSLASSNTVEKDNLQHYHKEKAKIQNKSKNDFQYKEQLGGETDVIYGNPIGNLGRLITEDKKKK